jgi:WD40 repeat protein
VVIADINGHFPLQTGRSIAFSPDGKFLAAGSRDGNIRLMDRRRGILPVLTAHVARVYSIVFHPHSNLMASGSGESGSIHFFKSKFSEFILSFIVVFVRTKGDGEVWIWDLRRLQDPPTRLPTNSPHIDCLAFNHDGSILASCGDGRIRLWNIQNHRCLVDFSDGNSRVVESISFSPDGQSLAAGNWGNRVCIWDLATQRCVTVLPESTIVHAVCWSPDSRYICSASDSKDLRLGKLADRSYTSLEGHRDSVWCVAFSPDGKCIASGSDDGTTRIFDTGSGRCRATFYHNTTSTSNDFDATKTTTVYGVAFSPCNNFVASAGDDGCIKLRRTNM